MALTTIKTGAIADDAITTDKLANAINTERTANTAKDLTALSASNLTSGTVPDARFPATLPAASAANLTSIPAGNLTGTVADARFPATLPAASAANLTSIPAANITGTLPAISGANLTGISSAGKAHNLIINGAMEVAQRLDTATTSSTSSGIHAVDRFSLNFSGTDESPTQSQSDVASGTTVGIKPLGAAGGGTLTWKNTGTSDLRLTASSSAATTSGSVVITVVYAQAFNTAIQPQDRR